VCGGSCRAPPLPLLWVLRGHYIGLLLSYRQSGPDMSSVQKCSTTLSDREVGQTPSSNMRRCFGLSSLRNWLSNTVPSVGFSPLSLMYDFEQSVRRLPVPRHAGH